MISVSLLEFARTGQFGLIGFRQQQAHRMNEIDRNAMFKVQ